MFKTKLYIHYSAIFCMKHAMHIFKVNVTDRSALLHFLVNEVESYLERQKGPRFSYLSQFATGIKIKVLIYPQFRVEKTFQKHIQLPIWLSFTTVFHLLFWAYILSCLFLFSKNCYPTIPPLYSPEQRHWERLVRVKQVILK